MPPSAYRATKIRKRTRAVVDYHRDDLQPGKPLHLLVPGGLIAVASLLTIIAVIAQTWFNEVLTKDAGVTWLVVLTPIYIGGVFLFSYGYELYALDRALWLTAVIVFTTVAIVLVAAVIAVLLGASGNSSSSSSSDKKKSSSGGSPGLGSSDYLGSSSSSRALDLGVLPNVSTSTRRSSSLATDVVDIIAAGFATSDSSGTTSAAEEEEAVSPDPVLCQFCSSMFIPEETKFTCPKCGAGYRDQDEASSG